MGGMYRTLADSPGLLPSLLCRSLTVAETLEEKVNLQLLNYILSNAGPIRYSSRSYCELTSFKHMNESVQGAHPWIQRQFLHAVLLSMGSQMDQQEAFQRLRGHEILLPIDIHSAWPRALQKTHNLLLSRSLVQRMELSNIIWFGPCQARCFLKELSAGGFPHIAQELQKHLNGKHSVKFKDKRGAHKGRSSAAAPPADFTILFRPHLRHPSGGDTMSCGEHSPDSWIFCVAGALAPHWTAVCEFLHVKEDEIQRVKGAAWYNNHHRLFSVLKSLQEERTLTPAQLTRMLLSYCETNRSNAHAQRVMRAALPYLCAAYQTLERSYSRLYPFHVTRSNNLLAVSSEPIVALEEITGAEFEPFLTSYAIVGPPVNVSAKPGDKVLIFLPSDVPLEMHWSQSHLSQCLESLSLLTHCDSLRLLHAQLSDLFNVEERERLFRYFLFGMFDEAAELILQNGSGCIQRLVKFFGTVGTQIRLWPSMYCSMIEASSILIGHLAGDNLEALVPLAYARNWAVILSDSFSPLALLMKLIKPNQTGAMFLLYKPVGRRYREQEIKLLKVFLIPQNESLLQELNDRQTGYKRVCKKRMVLEEKTCYRLRSTDTCFNVTPRRKAFQTVHSAEEMLTEFTVQLCKEPWKEQLLLLQLLKVNTKKAILEEQMDKEILNMEEDYIIMIHDSMANPLCVVSNDTSCESILQEIENQYPRERYTIYHTIDVIPTLVIGKSSLQYMLQKRPYGDCRLEAKEKVSHAPSTAPSPAPSSASSPPPLLAQFSTPSSAPLLALSSASYSAPSSGRVPDHLANRFLKENRADLVAMITEIDSTLDKLLNVGVITQEEYEIIRSNNLVREKVRVTLDSVVRKGSTASAMLCKILRQKNPLVMKELNY